MKSDAFDPRVIRFALQEHEGARLVNEGNMDLPLKVPRDVLAGQLGFLDDEILTKESFIVGK